MGHASDLSSLWSTIGMMMGVRDRDWYYENRNLPKRKRRILVHHSTRSLKVATVLLVALVLLLLCLHKAHVI